MKTLQEFEYKNFRYTYDENIAGFKNGFDNDLHIFLVWSKARIEEEKIINSIKDNFEVLSLEEIVWSEKHIDDNFHRIYDVTPTGGIAGKRHEVGDKPFLAIVVKDPDPMYGYETDASGRLKIVNLNIVYHKKLYRSWVGGSYMVHSTDNINEFFNNSVLLFGLERVQQFVSTVSENTQREVQKKSSLHRDLSGANGWVNYKDLFAVLNKITRYVVLRGADSLEATIENATGDVDILCEDINEFTAVLNGVNIWNSKNFFHVLINGKKILFDVRYVGDGYFDERWQSDILDNRVLTQGGVYAPRADDFFFSHLYHAFVHKPEFKKKYENRLISSASKIGVKLTSSDLENNNNEIIDILRGYMSASDYGFTIPNDDSVFLNLNFVSKLENINVMKLKLRHFSNKVKMQPKKLLLSLKLRVKKNQLLFDIATKIRQKFI